LFFIRTLEAQYAKFSRQLSLKSIHRKIADVAKGDLNCSQWVLIWVLYFVRYEWNTPNSNWPSFVRNFTVSFDDVNYFFVVCFNAVEFAILQSINTHLFGREITDIYESSSFLNSIMSLRIRQLLLSLQLHFLLFDKQPAL